MIDKMKEVAIKQFQQQQEVIDDKNREITLLIEHKNKEVSNVIQERKRSLDEKSKEVSKITQEKDKEILKLSQSLAFSKEDLLNSKKITGDFEIKQKELEESLEKLQKCVNEKEKQIKQMEKEMKLSEDEKGIVVTKIQYEKENVMAEKNREIKAITDGHKKEVSRLMEDCSHSKLEAARFRDEIEHMQTKQDSLEKQLSQKENVIFNLQKSLEESRKKTEFKTNLERSFESLQNQFQMKVDEIERLRKRLGLDEKRRRPSKEKKLAFD